MLPAVAIFVTILTLLGRAAEARQTPPPATPASNILDVVRHDPAARGPLLLVDEPGLQAPSHTPPEAKGRQIAPSAFAEIIGRRVITVGGLTALVPDTMYVIVERPGKPDPFAGLQTDERLKILLSTLSPAQWARAGGASGIGPGDLDENQQALFLGLLPPEKIVVSLTKLVPTETPSKRRFDRQGEPREFAPLQARLRLARRITFQFRKAGTDDYGYSGGAGTRDTNVTFALLENNRPSGDPPSGEGNTDAFGVSLVKTVPARLKPGDLDFAARALNALVALDDGTKTLGALLARVARATNLDLVADKRVAGLDVHWRVAAGQRARAGDVLQALCWSVSGAFRRVGSSTFLLTNDVAGIGTRWARLAEWAEAADTTRHKAMGDLSDKAAKNDPLSHLRFAPGDPYALTPEQTRRVDAAYRKARYAPAPEFNLSELSPALQRVVLEQAESWQNSNVSLRTDRVQIDMGLMVQFVLPGNLAVEPSFSHHFDSQYLRAVAVLKKTGNAAAQASLSPKPGPRPFPAALRKRVLLAPLPEGEAATTALLVLAKSKGFTEVWLRVLLDDPQAAAKRLTHAVQSGKTTGIAVGAAVSLLRSGGLAGAGEDVNLFGETGAQFAARRARTNPEDSNYYQRSAGWIVPDAGEMRRVTPIARVPGLSALALRATAAPGWAGHVEGGDGIPGPGDYLGYTTATRLACLRAEGLDPLDVVPDNHALNVDQSLPFFPAFYEDHWKTLNDFRLRQNKTMLAAVHAALARAAPTLPLFLDDRASSYTNPDTGWYGRWDAPTRVPLNPPFVMHSEARAAAFAASPEPLLNQRARISGTPGDWARALSDAAETAAKSWRGLTVDFIFTDLEPRRILQLLNALPSSAPQP